MVLENLRKELAELDVDIIHQRIRLQELEDRHTIVGAQIDAFIFPILTLPPEITAEIFLEYAFGEDDGNLMCPEDTLILLTICRAWRKLALSVPALWATFDAGTLPMYRDGPEEMEKHLETWFNRAGALPLSLYWFGTTVDPCSGQLNNVISRHAPRLRYLHICISLGCVSHLSESLPFLLLEDLYISVLDETTSPTPLATAMQTFREAPQLRHVAIEAVSPASLILPWHQLESFRAVSVTPQECLDVLRMASSLRKFEYYGSYSDVPFFWNHEPVITYPRMMSLHLYNQHQELLQYLSLPALEDLHLGSLSVDEIILLSFLSRSRESLRHFTSSGTEPILSTQCFRTMPRLTTLDLYFLQAQPRIDFVRALNRQYEDDFLPTLEKLTLRQWEAQHIDNQLLDALLSRCTATDTEDGRSRMQLTSFELIWVGDDNLGMIVAGSEIISRFLGCHEGGLADLQGGGTKIRIQTDGKTYI
ncbi:hypothetical protein C8R43DRAFT_1201819 [Mycena crocata]|nr:hypothetical protein C8R43DRAFT_1201819 [Mycena crocata]